MNGFFNKYGGSFDSLPPTLNMTKKRTASSTATVENDAGLTMNGNLPLARTEPSQVPQPGQAEPSQVPHQPGQVCCWTTRPPEACSPWPNNRLHS